MFSKNGAERTASIKFGMGFQDADAREAGNLPQEREIKNVVGVNYPRVL